MIDNLKIGFIIIALLLVSAIFSVQVFGAYGDIILNENRKEGMRPVVFPHWFHRLRFKCKVCHPETFQMKKGSNPINMDKIRKGEYCGKCHNGEIAFAPTFEYCWVCHSMP